MTDDNDPTERPHDNEASDSAAQHDAPRSSDAPMQDAEGVESGALDGGEVDDRGSSRPADEPAREPDASAPTEVAGLPITPTGEGVRGGWRRLIAWASTPPEESLADQMRSHKKDAPQIDALAAAMLPDAEREPVQQMTPREVALLREIARLRAREGRWERLGRRAIVHAAPITAGVMAVAMVGGLAYWLRQPPDPAGIPVASIAVPANLETMKGKTGRTILVTRGELDTFVAQRVAIDTARGQEKPKAGSPEEAQLTQQTLGALIRRQVVAIEQSQCGRACEVTDKDIDKEIASIINGSFNKSRSQFDDFLKRANLTTADVREIVRSDLAERKVSDHATRSVKFTDAQARAYYNKNKAQFITPAGRNVSHILVTSRAEAERLAAQANAENFASLARQYSTDPGSKSKGGKLGPLNPGQFVPPFEKVATALADREISAPVKTQFGWHVITVDVNPRRQQSFKEVKKQIIEQQTSAKEQDAIGKVLGPWDALVTYLDKALDPKNQPAQGQLTPAQQQAVEQATGAPAPAPGQAPPAGGASVPVQVPPNAPQP